MFKRDLSGLNIFVLVESAGYFIRLNEYLRGLLYDNTLYSVIAFAPNAPAIAEATAITTFRIISHTDFLIAMFHTSFRVLFWMISSMIRPGGATMHHN